MGKVQSTAGKRQRNLALGSVLCVVKGFPRTFEELA
jgi:hypothetical protein